MEGPDVSFCIWYLVSVFGMGIFRTGPVQKKMYRRIPVVMIVHNDSHATNICDNRTQQSYMMIVA